MKQTCFVCQNIDCQTRGSEALMKELFNRLKAEHFKFVTTGFFRPEYFYKFGFKVEKKYSGLFLDLQNFTDKV